jgi:hypothetical protein
MISDIVRETLAVNLDVLAVKIRDECAAAEMADRTALDHGINAGKHCIRVHKQIGRGFRSWLEQHGLKKTTCYDFMKLAEHEECVRRSGHSSIAAALRMLRATAGKPDKSKKANASSLPLSKASWTKATVQERQNFLDAIGADSLCAALSFTLRAELRRRVAGQQRATASPLNGTIAKAIRQALSLQRTTRPRDMPAAGVAAALNAINDKLEGAGFDLNNITIIIDRTTTQKQAG